MDDERFSELFFAHAGRLVRLARLIGANDPEDVVQDAFCRVFAARGRLRSAGDDAGAYLTRAVVNEVRDRHRRAVTARRKVHLLVPLDAETAAGADLGKRDALLRALAGLPPRQREALVLRFWLDLPLAEVAEAMGTRSGTAKSHVSRGLAALQRDLTDPIDESGSTDAGVRSER